MAPYTVYKTKNVANVKTDRVFKIVSLNEEGISVSRKGRNTLMNMFQGGLRMHAVQDSGLWYLEYRQENGVHGPSIPEKLKQRWTNYNQLRKYLDDYLLSRNAKIEEVIA